MGCWPLSAKRAASKGVGFTYIPTDDTRLQGIAGIIGLFLQSAGDQKHGWCLQISVVSTDELLYPASHQFWFLGM